MMHKQQLQKPATMIM